MFFQSFLGVTKLHATQIAIEIMMMLLLLLGLLLNNVKKIDISLIAVFFVFSIISFLLNDFNVFALNFKMFFLTILVIAYFTQTDFFPHKSILLFLFVNVGYAIYVKLTGNYILGDLSILNKPGVFVLSRPIGFLGSPHVTSTFIAIYLLYLFNIGKYRFLQIVLFSTLFVYASWTALVALIVHVAFMVFDKITLIRVNQVIFFLLFLSSVFIVGDILVEFMVNIKGSRYYSVEYMLPMFSDINYYNLLLTPYPKSSLEMNMFLVDTYSVPSNEFGLVKIFVEGGFVLSLFLMYRVISCTKYMTVFLLVTTLHYSFFVNTPFIMFLFVVLNKDIERFKSANYIHSKRPIYINS